VDPGHEEMESGLPMLLQQGMRIKRAVLRDETDECRLLLVALAVRDFLALLEHVFFGLLVGNI